MQIFLHDHVASARERRILLADDGGVDSSLIHWIFGPVDEADEVAIIEIVEAVHFVRRGDRATEPRHDLCRELEAQIHTRGADMKEDVARRCDGMMAPADLTERMQVFRLGRRRADPTRRNQTP